jgi:hypothetical protein
MPGSQWRSGAPCMDDSLWHGEVMTNHWQLFRLQSSGTDWPTAKRTTSRPRATNRSSWAPYREQLTTPIRTPNFPTCPTALIVTPPRYDAARCQLTEAFEPEWQYRHPRDHDYTSACSLQGRHTRFEGHHLRNVMLHCASGRGAEAEDQHRALRGGEREKTQVVEVLQHRCQRCSRSSPR